MTGPMGYVPPPGSIPTLAVPDLAGLRSVHLVGIGGAGMSGIARLLLARGVAVSGSDLKDSRLLAQLRAAGAEVHVRHGADQVGAADAVVVSTAIPPDNPEVARARERDVPVYARAQVLAALMAERRGIAVAGTHGKTTTTSMLAAILERAGRDPTYLVGGDLNESGSNARSGRGDVFVAEADESDGSFLLLSPEVAVVTNVEEDHLDFYGGGAEVEGAFARFCAQAGTVVGWGDDPAVRRVTASASRAVHYGEGDGNDVVVESIDVAADGSRGRIRFADDVVDVHVSSPGRHYILNAAAAIAAAREVARSGAVRSAHDVSDGGLACALAECAIAGDVGLAADLDELVELRGCSGETALFGEGPAGFLLAGDREALDHLAREGAAAGIDVVVIGRAGGDQIELSAAEAEVAVALAEAARAWRSLGQRMASEPHT